MRWRRLVVPLRPTGITGSWQARVSVSAAHRADFLRGLTRLLPGGTRTGAGVVRVLVERAHAVSLAGGGAGSVRMRIEVGWLVT